MANLLEGLKNGVRRSLDNPQLGYTIIIAVVIFFAFLFTADRFVQIAQDAQERLINVRVGSIHDTFVTVAPDISSVSTVELEEQIGRIVKQNQTIEMFNIVSADPKPRVIASLNGEQTGEFDEKRGFFFNLAATDPENSFTTEGLSVNGERFFETVRAIEGDQGTIVGFVVTRQTLSEADRKISAAIQNGLMTLTLVMVIVLALFFRHAKIIDYMTLYRKLQEVDELKDDFISMASHELRTPLTGIRGYAAFLKDSEHLNPKDREHAEKIDQRAQELDALVADMLDVSRIEQGRMKYDMDIVDPAQVITEVTESQKHSAEKKGLTLEYKPNAEGLIYADSKRLKQVLVNFVGNGIKYTEKGSVSIETSVTKGQYSIRVNDTGVGLTAEEQTHLFEKFYRSENAVASEVAGTGLGLWITKQIVEQMGGSISLESIKGVGSHFVVTFPIHEPNK